MGTACRADGLGHDLSGPAGSFRTERTGRTLVLKAEGRWTVATLAPLDARLLALRADQAQRVEIDLKAVAGLDTAGAWVLHRTLKQLAEGGAAAEFVSVRPEHESLLSQAERADRALVPHPRGPGFILHLLDRTGQAVFAVLSRARELVAFLGLVCITIVRDILNPRRIRFIAIVSHMERTGFDALPIVGLLSFLIGVVTAFQGADQLRRFGAEIFTVDLVTHSILRELGILLTAIIIAGRTGSAFTAEIGTMKVNEEIDAMTTLGLDPIEVLVLPRILALVITLPLLTFYADVMGLFGGALMSMASLDMSLAEFLARVQATATNWTFWIGMIKAPVFAFVIAMVGCFEGLKVERSAESVGRLTTQSVVEAIFLVIVLDAGFSVLFSYLGI
jgi:phospholipid/cholesterol/gamma-HCH transport system permease protein